MKAVFLLAGIGKRMGVLTKNKPKCLIGLNGRPLLGYLLDKFIANNIKDFVLIVGYKKDEIIEFVYNVFGDKINVTIVYNKKFKEANNIYSMWCAKDILAGGEFILCNGDVVISAPIIKRLLDYPKKSAIILDTLNKTRNIDSPRTIIENERIIDLGRHIPAEKNGGYAIGIYKFGEELSTAYFSQMDKMLKDNQYNAGFHDPLRALFRKYEVAYVSTGGLSWTELDTPKDIPHLEKVLQKIKIEES